MNDYVCSLNILYLIKRITIVLHFKKCCEKWKSFSEFIENIVIILIK